MTLTIDRAKELVIEFCKTYPVASTIGYKIRETQEEIYGPQATREAVGTILGSFHSGGGEALFATSNFDSDEKFRGSLRHEVLGHFGINTFNSAEKRSVLEALVAARNEPSLESLWAKVDRAYPGTSDSRKAEEVFAFACEGIASPGGRAALEGARSFYETCIDRSRLMQVDDLINMTTMVAEGLHDRSRSQQIFPASDDAQFKIDTAPRTSDYPVWLAVPHADREAVREAAGRLENGRAAVIYDKEAKLWCARPGCDLSRIEKWLPDTSLRAGGGDPEAQFLDALTQEGLIVKGMPVMDGRRHRVATVEDKNGKKTGGVYCGFLDRRPGGWFINYHRAETEKSVTNWSATGGESDPVASLHIRAAARQSQDDAQREREQLYAQRTQAAKRLYDRLPAADPAHPYLVRKGITPTPELRETKNGALVVPFFNASGDFKTLQYITEDGDKLLFKDAPKQGNFLVVGGSLEPGQPVLYAEGYATARSLNLATGHPVVMTVDAGNMLTVAKVLHEAMPDSAHTFLADFDHTKDQNKGLLMANAAAELVGGHVLYPAFTDEEKARGLTDFNDIHLSRGLEALRGLLAPNLIKYDEVTVMQENDHPEPDTPKTENRKALVEPERTVEPATVVQRRDEQLTIPLEPALSAPAQDAPNALPASQVEPGSFAPNYSAQALGNMTVTAQSSIEMGPTVNALPPDVAAKDKNSPLLNAGPTPSIEASATATVGNDGEVTGPVAKNIASTPVIATDDPLKSDVNVNVATPVAGAADPVRQETLAIPVPKDQSQLASTVISPNIEASSTASLGNAENIPITAAIPKTLPTPAAATDEPLDVNSTPQTAKPQAMSADSTGQETPVLPIPEPVPLKKPEPAPQESVADAIVLGPPRPSGAEVEPQASNLDKDALLARLSWEKQDDSTILYKLDGEAAFIDRGSRLEMAKGASQNDEMVVAALLTAAQYYRGRIELTGSDEFKAKAIEMIAQHEINVVMKNPVQQAMLDDARKSLNAVPVVPDAVLGETMPHSKASLQVPQPTKVEVPQAAAPVATTAYDVNVPQHNSAPAPVKPSALEPIESRPKPDEASSSVNPSIHQSYKAAEHGVTGKVMDFGKAPFKFEKDNAESTYITLRTKTGTQTFWGKELAGLLRETRVQPGRVVDLQWLGKEPVVIKVPRKNEEGVTIRFEDKETHRNQWQLTVRGNPAVLSGRDEGVQLAAYDGIRFAQIQQNLVKRLNLNLEVPKPPVDGLYWMTPNGQGSFKSGDELSAPRPGVDAKDAGQPVISSWSPDGHLDMHLVRGDGPYLQGVVRQGKEFQHVLVSLPASTEAPSMVFNAITPDGLVPIGSGNGINRSGGESVSRENIAFKLQGDTAVRIGKLDAPADLPPTLHARLGFDERWKEDSNLPKSAPTAAPSVRPSEPRPA